MEEVLTQLLSGVADGRRHWGRAPQKAPRPYVIMNAVSALPDYTMEGPSGYVASRFQIDCYADTYTATKQLSRAVIAKLSGYASGNVLGIFNDGVRDLPASDAGEVTNLFRTSIDIMVHHKEL